MSFLGIWGPSKKTDRIHTYIYIHRRHQSQTAAFGKYFGATNSLQKTIQDGLGEKREQWQQALPASQPPSQPASQPAKRMTGSLVVIPAASQPASQPAPQPASQPFTYIHTYIHNRSQRHHCTHSCWVYTHTYIHTECSYRSRCGRRSRIAG